MLNNIKAKNIMARNLVTLRTTDDIYTGLRTLLEHNISGAPVLDDDENFVGVFTEKSCMNVIIADQYHGMTNRHVEAYVFRHIKTISPETTLLEIGMLFLNEPLRRLPVVDDGKLVGQVSRRDVLRVVYQLHHQGKAKTKFPIPLPYYSALIDPLENSQSF